MTPFSSIKIRTEKEERSSQSEENFASLIEKSNLIPEAMLVFQKYQRKSPN